MNNLKNNQLLGTRKTSLNLDPITTTTTTTTIASSFNPLAISNNNIYGGGNNDDDDDNFIIKKKIKPNNHHHHINGGGGIINMNNINKNTGYNNNVGNMNSSGIISKKKSGESQTKTYFTPLNNFSKGKVNNGLIGDTYSNNNNNNDKVSNGGNYIEQRNYHNQHYYQQQQKKESEHVESNKLRSFPGIKSMNNMNEIIQQQEHQSQQSQHYHHMTDNITIKSHNEDSIISSNHPIQSLASENNKMNISKPTSSAAISSTPTSVLSSSQSLISNIQNTTSLLNKRKKSSTASAKKSTKVDLFKNHNKDSLDPDALAKKLDEGLVQVKNNDVQLCNKIKEYTELHKKDRFSTLTISSDVIIIKIEQNIEHQAYPNHLFEYLESNNNKNNEVLPKNIPLEVKIDAKDPRLCIKQNKK